MKKRKLLSLTLAGAMVLGSLAACGEKTPDPTPTPEAVEATYDNVKSADVIIVGAGGGGLSAAISAVDAGAKSVIIIERTGVTGGGLNYTSGTMSGAETIIQELDGIEDTKESYVQDILKNGAQKGNEAMIRTYVDEDVDAINWLWENGLNDNDFTMQGEKRSVFAPEHALYSIQRSYKAKPHDATKYKSAAHEVLDQYIAANCPQVSIDFNTTATALVGNEQGQVLSVAAVGADGKTTLYTAEKGVIMATGGYSGNKKLMGEYAEYGSEYLAGGSTAAADGVGIRMMQLVGAKVDPETMGYIPTFPMGYDRGDGTGAIAPSYTWKAGGICVNQEGKRFVDETEDAVEIREVALEEQTNAIQYDIFTDKIIADLQANKASTFWDFFYSEGKPYSNAVVTASSLEELAEKLGMPAENLKATVEEYNSHVKSGETDEFGRQFTQDSLNTYNLAINEISGDKFYAVPLKALCVMTLGGVTTNTDTQVLDESGNVIPGLYAVGECVGGIWGKFVSGGTGVMGPIAFGRIAGRHVMANTPATGAAVKAASYVLDESLFPELKVGGNKTDASFDMSKTLADGEYEATVDGQEGTMTVKTTIADGKIAKVEVTENHETASIGGPALESVPDAIVAANSVTVDAVSGATLTSNRIASAVQQCLEQAAK